jgi:fumarate reductase flavoprotein subunit
MELGPRDRLSQAFWQEERKGRTVTTPAGEAVLLDLRHLGPARLNERLPLICDLAKEFMNIDPAEAPIPVRPAVHYTMGGIPTDINTATSLAGLFAAGECSSVGIHGANRLGSNSLSELFVFGHVAGDQAVQFAKDAPASQTGKLIDQAKASAAKALALRDQKGSGERHSALRKEMAITMEKGCGIYRLGTEMQETCDKLAELQRRYRDITIEDRSAVWNTDWLNALELGYQLDVAQAMAHSALERRESRGAHQRLDGFETRDDVHFLAHSLAHYREGEAPGIDYGPVKITKSQPGQRAYGALGEKLEKAKEDSAHG